MPQCKGNFTATKARYLRLKIIQGHHGPAPLHVKVRLEAVQGPHFRPVKFLLSRLVMI